MKKSLLAKAVAVVLVAASLAGCGNSKTDTNQADSVLADVLLVADSVTFESFKEQDLMMSYESPELKGIPEEFID